MMVVKMIIIIIVIIILKKIMITMEVKNDGSEKLWKWKTMEVKNYGSEKQWKWKTMEVNLNFSLKRKFIQIRLIKRFKDDLYKVAI